MTEERKLYPLRFCSILDEYVWGKDEFILADLGYRDSLVKDGWLAANTISEVMDTYLDRWSETASMRCMDASSPCRSKESPARAECLFGFIRTM